MPDPFPDSIRRYLDSGGDISALPDFDSLVDEVTFARAAGLADHQRSISQGLVDELVEKAADALPADLFANDEHRAAKAAEWRRHQRWTVELLADEELAARFDAALPPGRLDQELAAAADWRRREIALAALEAWDYDAMTTAELERLAEYMVRFDIEEDRP